MKKQDIVVGGTYSNGKQGRLYSERKIIEEGSHLAYICCKDTDFVKYEVVSGYGNGLGRMTRLRFASWAKKRIDG